MSESDDQVDASTFELVVEPEAEDGVGASQADGPGDSGVSSSEGADAPASEPDAAPSVPTAGRSSVVPPAPPGGPLPDTEQGETARRGLRVVVVAGARGGVGKTMLAANLGLYLSTIGRKVVLVDADPSGANLHTCIGASAPIPLARFRRGGRGEGPPIPDEALRTTPVPSLRLLHMGFDEPAMGTPRGDRLTRLVDKLRTLDAEYVVVDLGVGLGRDHIDAFLSADTALFVTAPEPTAIENTYRFLRGAFLRWLMRQELTDEEVQEIERRVKAAGGAPPPLDLLRGLESEGHPLAPRVRAAMEAFRLRMVINQTRLRADLQLGFALSSAVRRRYGIAVDYLGHIDHDDTVWTCMRNRRPVLLEVPGAKSSKKIEKVARRVLMIEAGKEDLRFERMVPEASHHDLLEVERGATDEEIRRAYKRCREVYAHDALCCYGLLEAHEIEQLRARIDEAFDVLLDPSRRRPYELSMFPQEPEPVLAPPVPEHEEPARPAPEITPDTQFTGALLQQVRESRRITLRDISQKTKISVTYLEALEREEFRRLPALVYTTGFVTEYARYLKLEPQQVSRTYVGRYRRYLEERAREAAGGS